MIRDDIAEELGHLEEIAIGLGRLKIKAQSLPLTIESVSTWKHELDAFILGTDQLDLHATLLARSVALGDITTDNCQNQLDHYVEIIDQMRSQLYHLKAINRSVQSKQDNDVVIGKYRISLGGRIFFRDSEITFGGKLRAILVAFLVGNDEHVLTAAEIARIWGDDNMATVSKHKCKLDEALTPHYGDRRKHITRVRTTPTTYQLEIG